jgi:DNA-directed RNA polymerase subunit omega
MAERTTRSPIFAIPDDPELSAYRFIIVAAKRARQLQSGARSFLPSTSKKPTVAAMEEVRAAARATGRRAALPAVTGLSCPGSL